MRRRECAAEGCEEEPSGPRKPFCHGHEHEWVGAAEIPLEGPQVAIAARSGTAGGIEISAAVWVIVRDVYCAHCRLSHVAAKGQPCYPADTALRGGPVSGYRSDQVATGRP